MSSAGLIQEPGTRLDVTNITDVAGRFTSMMLKYVLTLLPRWPCMAVAVGTIIADRPRTEPYERHYRIRLPPWRIGERCCYSHTVQSLEHSLRRAVSV